VIFIRFPLLSLSHVFSCASVCRSADCSALPLSVLALALRYAGAAIVPSPSFSATDRKRWFRSLVLAPSLSAHRRVACCAALLCYTCSGKSSSAASATSSSSAAQLRPFARRGHSAALVAMRALAAAEHARADAALTRAVAKAQIVAGAGAQQSESVVLPRASNLLP
jgi:hypothetical protein